jgi:hypothetical protein
MGSFIYREEHEAREVKVKYKTFKTVTLILHEPEAFMCKAFKGEAIVDYASALVTQQMETSSSPGG